MARILFAFIIFVCFKVSAEISCSKDFEVTGLSVAHFERLLVECPTNLGLLSLTFLANMRDGYVDKAKRLLQTRDRLEKADSPHFRRMADRLLRTNTSLEKGIVLTRIKTGMGGWADRVKSITSGFIISRILEKVNLGSFTSFIFTLENLCSRGKNECFL